MRFCKYSFMDERLDRQYYSEKLFGNIFTAFVVLSLVIACLALQPNSAPKKSASVKSSARRLRMSRHCS
ncbi:MAG: hypothetical protein ACE5I1_23475 [bacterium]